MKIINKILSLGYDEQANGFQNFSTRLLNQIAIVTLILISLYMTAHILMQNSWIAVAFDLVYITTAFLILYFNKTKRYKYAHLTVGIGYTIAFSCSSILIGSQNQIEYLLFISGIGTAILINDETRKKYFYYFTLLVFIGLKFYHIYEPQGLLQKDFSPYFKIVNGSLVFIFVYTIVSRSLKKGAGLLEKLQSKNKEISTLNETLEIKVKERTQELAQSNKEIKKFSYISAHDLREPLRNIVGFSELLKKSIAEKNDKETEINLSYINWGVKRIDAITRDVVIYTELEERSKSTSDVDLNELIQKIIITKSKVNQKMQLQVDSLPTININLYSANLLFDNIISNAIQYCKKPIVNIFINYELKDQFHQFKISDNGQGIEPQYHQKIFELFTRLHNDFDRNGSGTGLAFCKKIIDNCGGEIWVESEFTKGCDFYFTIPV